MLLIDSTMHPTYLNKDMYGGVHWGEQLYAILPTCFLLLHLMTFLMFFSFVYFSSRHVTLLEQKLAIHQLV